MSTIRNLFLLVLVAAPAAAHADGVRHLPPAQADAGSTVELVADVADPGGRTIVLHYRARGAAAWTDVAFAQRADRKWVAAIPPAAVAAPGVEYYLASVPAQAPPDGAAIVPADEFASAAAPHPVVVRDGARAERRARDLARVNGRRSRVTASAEYIDFGRRDNMAGAESPDRYYRVDLDFRYRLLAYPLEEIRFGYTRLEGTVPNAHRQLPDSCTPDTEGTTMCRASGGFKVGGWFELGLALAEGLRLDARGMFTANQDAFALGTRAELRAGVADANHVAVGFEYLDDVGTSGFFRLGWATVPALPMAATVEVTDLPNNLRATGVRLMYDVFYPMPSGLRLGARVGYSARDQIIGGPTAGASASFDF